MFDGEVFGQQMVEVVKGYVDRQTAPLIARIAELEAREMPAAIQGERGEKGEPGEPADMEMVKQWVAEGVAAAVEAIPAPEAKEGERGPEGPAGQKGADGADGKPGADGIGLADAMIDKDGNLHLTMTNGQVKNLGSVHGKDGNDGKDGESLTLDDFDVTQVDERSLEFSFTKGDVTHSFEIEFPVAIYRGVYENEREYAKGDMVTWAGSLWHANEATASKPGSDGPWQLAAKKGRDGRDAK